MPVKYYNKVIYGGKILIDLTEDTVEANKLLVGATAHKKTGEVIEGTCDFDVNSSVATATPDEILEGKTAAVNKKIITGAMKNNGSVKGDISDVNIPYTIPQGFHDGSGKVGIKTEEKAKLIPQNIREGVTVLGVKGEMSGTEGAKPQEVTITPSTSRQEKLPDSVQGYNYISRVIVEAIPYQETENPVGGLTVNIA